MFRVIGLFVVLFTVIASLCSIGQASDPPFDNDSNSEIVNINNWVTIDTVYENTGTGTINISGVPNSSGKIRTADSFTNSGTIYLRDYGRFESDANFLNLNELRFEGKEESTFSSLSGKFTSTGSIVIDNNIACFDSYSAMENSGTITNRGTFRLDNKFGLENNFTNSGTIQNYNTMNITNNSKVDNIGTINNYHLLSIGNSTLTNNNILNNNINTSNNSPGYIHIESSGILDNKATLTNSGTIIVGDAPSMPVTVNRLINSGTIKNQGTISILNLGILKNTGSVENSGIFTLEKGSQFDCSGDGKFYNNAGGVLNVKQDILLDPTKGTIYLNTGGTVNNYATIVLADGESQDNAGTFYNYGTFKNQGGTIQNSGILHNLKGGTILNSAGTVLNTENSTVINNGTINVTGGAFINKGFTSGNGVFYGNFVNYGTVRPGNSIGTVSVDSITSKPGSTLEIEVDNSGSDLIVVKDKAIIEGGTVKVITVDNNIAVGQERRYTFLTAGGGVFGAFTGIDYSPYFTFALDQDAHNMYVVLRRIRICNNENECAIEPVVPDDVMHVIYGLTADEGRAAYNQIAGLAHTAVPAVTFAYFNQYMDIVAARMSGFGTGGSTTGMLAVKPVMYTARMDSGSDAGNRLLMAANDAMTPSGTGNADQWGFWMQAYGSLGQRRADDVSSKYDYDTAGIVAGFDKEISSSFLVGATVGYSYTKLDMKDLAENSKMSSYQGSVYGMYKDGPYYLGAIAAYGYNRYDTRRDMAFGSLVRSASSDYNGNIFSVYLEGGRVYSTSYADIIPIAAIRAGYFMRDAFDENDAGTLNIHGDKMNVSSYITSIGARLTKKYKTEDGIIIPEIRIRWDHEFSNDQYTLDGAYLGSTGGIYTVTGDRPDRDRLVGGVGIYWQLEDNIFLNLLYEGAFAADDTRHAGMVGCTFRW